MSENCVRGCTKPVYEPETREKLGDEPIPATVGHLCARDAEKLREWLRELPDLVAMLDTRLGQGDPYKPERHGKVSGSPALVRLDVAAMLDSRSTATRKLEEGEARPAPDDVKFGGDVPGVLVQWADCLCDDLSLMADEDQIDQRPATLIDAVDFLAGTWWSNVVYRPWIDELYTEIHEIRGMLRAFNNIRDPVSIGSCECGQKLYLPEDGTSWIRCKRCGHRMDGLAVVRLRTAQAITEATA